MKTKSIILATLLAAGAAAQADTLYVMGGFQGNPALHTLDPVTGDILSSVFVTGQQALFGGLGAQPSTGRLYSLDGYNDGEPDRLFSIEPGSGTGTVIGPSNENWNFRCMEVHPTTQEVYGMRDNALYTFNQSTGAATLVANLTSSGSLDQLTAFAISAKGVGYATDIGDTGLFEINLETGAMTYLGDLDPGSSNWYNDLAFDGDGRLIGCRRDGGVFNIDIPTVQHAQVFGGFYFAIAVMGEGGNECYADCDLDGSLTIDDFICFQTIFAIGDPTADCDGSGSLDIDDFICFQTLFAIGC